MAQRVFDLADAEQLRAALAAAFNAAGLRRLTADLDKRLDELKRPHATNLGLIAAVIIDHHAGQEGGIARLLATARAEAPVEPALAALAAAWAGVSFLPNPDLHLAGLAQRRFLGVPEWNGLLFGRETVLEGLTVRLQQGRGLALYGAGGAGKSALALALCHSLVVRSRFPGGVLWASLGQTGSAAGVLGAWEEALELPPLPELGPAPRRQRIVNRLGDEPMLVVLDDVWDAAVAGELLPAAAAWAHLITTRDVGIAEEVVTAAHAHPVAVLEPQPGREMLAALAPRAWQSDPARAAALADAAGGLPLALRVLGAYLSGGAAAGRGRSGPRLFFPDQHGAALDEMADPKARLDQAAERLGSAGAATLRDALALSLSGLPEEAVAAFGALGAFAPSPARFSWEAATEVTQGDSTALAWLVTRSLLDVYEGGHVLALHQMIAGLAAERTAEAALARHRRHYLAAIQANPGGWQAIELLYAQAQHAAAHAPDGWAAAYEGAVSTYQTRRSLWADNLALLERVQRHAEQQGDERRLGYVANSRGYAYDALGQKRRALECYEQALVLRRRAGDAAGEATTLNNMGMVYFNLGEKERALEQYEQALPLFRRVGDVAGEAATLGNTGLVHSALGEKRQALGYHKQALALLRMIDDAPRQAAALGNTGAVYSALGEPRRALEHLEQALPLFRRAGDVGGEATTLHNIGMVYSELGEKRRALERFEQALELSRRVGDLTGEATTLTSMALAHRSLGEPRRARERYEQALPLLRRVGDAACEALALNNIGAICDALGEPRRALEWLEQALEARRRAGDVAGEAATLNNLGAVYRSIGEPQAALERYEQALPLQRRVGDAAGEAVTRFNLAMIYRDWGGLAAAEEQLVQVVALDERCGHPDLESDRAALERVRAERRAGG